MSHVPCHAAIALVLLVGLVWALFRQTGDFEFLRLDDHDYTYRCAFVKDGLSWANVREAFTNVRHGGIWMPATYISYMCDITLFGPGAGAHHLVNIGVHALNAVLLLCLLLALGQRILPVSAAKMAALPVNSALTGKAAFQAAPTGILPVVVAFLLTALWAVHPQRAEAVAWIAGRKELLCATFILGGLLCWLRARRREGWGWIPALVGTYACFILACMSKPTAMCFPFLVLALEGIQHSTADNRQPTTGNHRFTFYILHFALFLLLAAATGALAVYSQTHPEGHAVRELFSASLPWRILNASVAVGLYVFQMVVPVGIHLDYRAVPGGWPVQGVLGLCVLAVLVAGAWWWCRRIRRRTEHGQASDRAGLFLMGAVILWFFAALAPTLGIFGSFGEHARADRFLYLPAMALPIAGAVLCGARGARALPVRPPRRGGPTTWTTGILPVAGLAAVVAVFFAVAYPVVASYRTDMTAFTRTLESDPDNWRALAHVGEAKCAEGQLDEGIDMLRRSRTVLARDATDGKLAYALMRRGRADDWGEITNVCAAVASDPSRDARGQALEALGTAELVGRDWHSAALHLLLSIQTPGRHYSSADAILKLAFAQHNGGRRAEARKLFEWVRDSSGREDLAKRAREVLSVLEYSPHGMLFW